MRNELLKNQDQQDNNVVNKQNSSLETLSNINHHNSNKNRRTRSSSSSTLNRLICRFLLFFYYFIIIISLFRVGFEATHASLRSFSSTPYVRSLPSRVFADRRCSSVYLEEFLLCSSSSLVSWRPDG